MSQLIVPRRLALPRSLNRQRGFLLNPYRFGSAADFAVDAADFDGTNDHIARGANLTGAANSKLGTLSLWFRVDGGDGTTRRLLAGADSATLSPVQRFHIGLSIDNQISFICLNGIGLIFSMESSSPNVYPAGATWHWLGASWDIGSNVGSLYVDETQANTLSRTQDATVQYADFVNWMVGNFQHDTTLRWNGGLAEVWFNPGTYIDLTVQANREKFRASDGKPADLGATGATPTGSAPLLYMHLDDGETANNLAINRGTGGNFTVTGSLDTCSTSPSD